MPRRAAAGAGGGAELGAGLARVGWLEDLASAGRGGVVGRRFAWRPLVRPVNPAFGARSHFVERRLARPRMLGAGRLDLLPAGGAPLLPVGVGAAGGGAAGGRARARGIVAAALRRLPRQIRRVAVLLRARIGAGLALHGALFC